jgi:glycosyltransferase involved in cell wall biosynthesis
MSEWDVVQRTKSLARDLGIQDRVRFIGSRYPREIMPAFYRLLRVYVSPSKAENLGQPLVESQLTGLPLVTYRGFSFDFVACPGTAEQIPPVRTVTDDYGLVIPEADPAVLAAAIRRARQTAEREGSADVARNWTYEKFNHHNAQTMVTALEEYRQCLR